MKLENRDIRDEYYKEIYDMKPKWWMRKGIALVFIILSIIVFSAQIIKYPDVIYAEFRLTTNTPTVILPINNNSQIEKILISNSEYVNKNDVLLILKNDSNYKDVFLLENELNNFIFQKDSIVSFFKDFLNKNLQLGSIIENDWLSFSNELLEFYKIEQLGTFKSQVQFLKNELEKQYKLKKQYQKLISTNAKQQRLLINNKNIDSTLFAKGVISKMDYNNTQQNYLKKSNALIQNKLSLNQVNLDIVRIQNSVKNKGNSEEENLLSLQLGIRNTFNKLITAIDLWKKTYTIITPISGKIAFLQNLKEGRFYSGNTIAITPNNKLYNAIVQIPFSGAGKVSENQKVILKLKDYPYREFGTLTGKLSDYSTVAGDQYYLGKITLKNETESSYKKKIIIRENMMGIAEIITNDRSLLGRLFQNILYAFKQ